jgi:tetratricopeptide (TPR) repeat protein
VAFFQQGLTVADSEPNTNNNGLPEGYKAISEEESKKAAGFFEKARVVADTGNLEYAIEMYLQGLAIDPEAIDAHKAMRQVALVRRANGGKSMSMSQRWGLPKAAKDDHKQAMLNAEKQLAYDPGNADHMVGVLTSAQKGGFYDTVIWIGDILFRSQMELEKKDFSKLMTLKNVFNAIHEYQRAIEVLDVVRRSKADDMNLGQELKDLAAKATITRGKYEEGDFRKSMRDVKGQQDLQKQDKDIRTLDAMQQMILEAEQAYAEDPTDPGRLAKLIELLRKTETTEYENRAIELLDQKYNETRAFRYRQQIGLIQIAQMARYQRQLTDAARKNPTDVAARKELQQFLRERAEREFGFFRDVAENYPTDGSAKFEMAQRLFVLGRYDEAIPVFQQIRTDPKYKAQAGMLLGRAFLEAGFPDEAVDTLQGVIGEYPVKGDERSIEMHYWYARALEEKRDLPTAIKNYSQVAQWNFTYRDVQQRIKRLRNPAQPGGGTSSAPASAPGAATS